MKTTSRVLAVAALAGVAGFYVACSHNSLRDPASDILGYEPNVSVSEATMQVLNEDAQVNGGNVHMTTGLNMDEAIDLWHLSEGSDVFPLLWLTKMQSQTTTYPKATYLYQDLDKKFGVIPETQVFAERSPYPLKWVGVTAAWSSEDPRRSDVRLERGQKIDDVIAARDLPNRQKSIAMMGVNCAFCHTSQITLNGQTRMVEGGPNMVNIRGFFQDLYGSAAKTMLIPDLLEAFLTRAGVRGDVHTISKNFSRDFNRELGLNVALDKKIGQWVNILDEDIFEHLQKKTENKIRLRFFQKREVVARYLTKLLQVSYGLDSVSNELQQRMKFLAVSIGVDPSLPTTPEGFARTDAFGRIANLVARTKSPIPLTATSSVPYMWNIGYRAFFHWNANTNSVVMRNIGQSFGLGSILTNPNGQGSAKYDGTENLHNLHRLENLVYKIRAPRYDEFTNEIDLPKAVAGCNLYQQNCAKCHTPSRDRVGPTNELIAYKVFPLKAIGTDATYTQNQSKPVEGVPFKDALFTFTRNVRARYYERFNVSPQEQAEWERRSMRGPELFRDTYLGESGQQGISSYMNISATPAPGYPARPLGGAWATAPFLHNGSVPNLYEMLKPASQRPKIFFVGSREYDTQHMGFRSDFASLPTIPDLDKKAQDLMKGPGGIVGWLSKAPRPATIEEARIQVACSIYPERCFHIGETGNSNAGHEGQNFGTTWTEAQKYELIEFMKILRPEVEYSDPRATPRYSYDGQSCKML